MNLLNLVNLKKVTVVALAIVGGFTLIGCEEFHGGIDVKSPVLMRSEKGEQLVQPGHYNVTIDFPKDERVRLTLASKVKKGVPQAYIKIPKKSGFPTFNGRINLPAGENRQNFDIEGDLRTDVDDSPEYRTTETCSISVTETVCERNNDGSRSCRVSGRHDYDDHRPDRRDDRRGHGRRG